MLQMRTVSEYISFMVLDVTVHTPLSQYILKASEVATLGLLLCYK